MVCDISLSSNVESPEKRQIASNVLSRLNLLWSEDQARRSWTHTFTMWSRGGRNQIIWQIIQRSRNNILSLSAPQKSSSWLSLSILGSEREEVKKTTSSLSIRSAMIRTSLKMILIIVTFTFLSSACSCSTANLIKDPGEWKTNIIWVLFVCVKSWKWFGFTIL